MERWDAIVVGAGLGGLVCGALLAKGGKKVQVLEARARVGGRATTREVEGIKMDHGTHFMAAGGHIERVLANVGTKVDFVYVDPALYIYHNKGFVGMPNRLADFRNFEYVPAEQRAELVDILDGIKQMPFEEAENYDSISLKDWLAARTRSEAICQLIALMANVFQTQENIAEIAAGAALRCIRQALRNEGAWFGYPRAGGFNTINLAFAEAIVKNGGQVRTGVRVREILIRDGAVTGVVAESSEGLLKAEAPIVVSNVPVVNIFELVTSDNFPKWFVEQIHLLNQYLYGWTCASIGVSFIATKPLHNLKSAAVIPSGSLANRAGPSYIKWVFVPTNLTPNVAPPGKHYFAYGNIIPRPYADLLRDMKWIYAKEIEVLKEELWQIFPDFDRGSILQTMSGVVRLVDATMQFPGNSWKQRLDVKAPAVDGLYLVGDMVCGWGSGTDTAAHSGILCAEKILKTNQP